MKTSLFIVDDHYMVIEGIRSLLQNEKDIDWLGHATNGKSCLAFLEKQQPDVILMDINLPDVNGTDLCSEVKRRYPSIFVLGLSTYNQHAVINNMIDNGASGYLLKNATKEELLLAIATVMRGKKYLSMEASMSLKDKPGEKPVISRREKEVLVLIADGLTNNEIAEKLFISVPTVNTHRKSLLAKFKAKNVASMVRMAVQMGVIG